MPKYFVYDTRTGDIVHTHETVDAVSGNSLPCTREEVLEAFGDVEGDHWDIIEGGDESISLDHSLRVDTKTKTVMEVLAASGQQLRIVTVTLGSAARFLDALETADQDFNVVTRPNQNNNTQRWLLRTAGTGVVTIQQLSNGRYLDTESFRVVTNEKQPNNDTQRWRLLGFGGGFFKIQQVSTNRVLQATLNTGFPVVAQAEGGTDMQVWRIVDAELIAE
jgi:hypothetical protein